MTRGLHHKSESRKDSFKVVNLAVDPVAKVIHSTSLMVGSWSSILDLIVIPLDDHTVLLGQEFLRLVRTISISHVDYLTFMNETKTFRVPMVRTMKFGWMPRMSFMRLIEVVGNRPCLISQQQGEMVLIKIYLGAPVGVIQENDRLKALVVKEEVVTQ